MYYQKSWKQPDFFMLLKLSNKLFAFIVIFLFF